MSRMDDATISTTLRLPVSPEQAASYTAAARVARKPLAEWITAALDDAVHTDYNLWLRFIAATLELRHEDIARACTLGGYEATRSNVRAWLAGRDSTKIGAHGQTLYRYRPMPCPAFVGFITGLRALLDEQD